VDAIRQVRSAKDGYIQYSQLGDLAVAALGVTCLPTTKLERPGLRRPILSDDVDDTEDPYRDHSRQFTGIAYDIGAGYILSAENPDAVTAG
jgi:hypothetical protein